MHTLIPTMIAAVLLSGAHGQTADPSPVLRAELAPLAFLADACWHGEFPGGQSFDVHCFESVYGGQYLRDIHAVPQGDRLYRGETLYHWDAENTVIRYRYYNSLGGVSDGTAQPDGDTIRFPDETYRGEDGLERVFSSTLRRDGADAYIAATWEVLTDEAILISEMRFERLSRAEAEQRLGAPL